MMRRFAIGSAFLAVMLLAGGVIAGCAPHKGQVPAAVASPMAPDKYGFSVLSVESDAASNEGAKATVYLPVFWSGVEVRVRSVEPYAFGSEVCAVSVVGDVETASGACELLVLERLDSREGDRVGTLDGLRVLLTGLTSGEHEFDVFMFPVPQNTKTGEWHYDYEAPAVDRLRVHVPEEEER
ncbi:hypothetical protein AB0O87_10585 [Microbacterium sp. NPDC076768]|uniref:hypothetical protein n=1 Tax=Microbacterium sp. NPDC076768 TaxID=3154858 RepID=UPI00343427B0